MTTEDRLKKASSTLKSGVLKTEAQVRAAVISPILQALGWDPADPDQWCVEWRVEFDVGVGYVDDALFGPGGTALVFVEAKRPGNLDLKAEDQLFRYAAHNGVPTLVLTDGDTWDLYLSMAAGKPADRRFAHLVISESRSLDGMAGDLRQFLGREAVLSGAADDAAKERLKQVKDRDLGEAGLQPAWKELLNEPDEMLRDLLIERVEQDSGSRPWAEDVDAFLSELADRLHSPTAPPDQYPDARSWLLAAPANMTSAMKADVAKWLRQIADSSTKPKPKGAGNLRGFRFRGESHPAMNGWETLTALVAELEHHKHGLLEDLAALGAPKRKWPRAVRVGDPRLAEPHKPNYRPVDSHGEWLLLVHGSTATKVGWMQQMVEMAGLVWGSEVEPIFEGTGD